MHIGRRRGDRMNDFRLAVHADMGLHAEVPLVAFLGLMHLGISFLRLVLRRTRRTDDGRIHDRPPVHLQALLRQILADPGKAMGLSFYPNKGVGLLRMEFIITNSVKVHPMALVKFDELKDEKEKRDWKVEGLRYALPEQNVEHNFFLEPRIRNIFPTAATLTKKYIAYLFKNDSSKPDGIENNKVPLSQITKLTGFKF